MCGDIRLGHSMLSFVLNYMHMYMYMVQIQILFNYVSHIHILAAGTSCIVCQEGSLLLQAPTNTR